MTDVGVKTQFENFISLGYFCEVAGDLEKLGLRNTSSPFDWCITDFSKNIELIENRFDDFMNYNNLAQSIENRNHYEDTKYNDFFFHDFTKYKPLNEQYEAVKAKYDRRIKRFLKNIESPTLFVRYISNEEINTNGRSIELEWIENNKDYIDEVLKSYNPNNQIIFIGDSKTHSDKIKIYNVDVDEGDIVSRSPIYNNTELYPIMEKYHVKNQNANRSRYILKQKRKNRFTTKIISKFDNVLDKLVHKEYHHTQTYDIKGK